MKDSTSVDCICPCGDSVNASHQHAGKAHHFSAGSPRKTFSFRSWNCWVKYAKAQSSKGTLTDGEIETLLKSLRAEKEGRETDGSRVSPEEKGVEQSLLIFGADRLPGIPPGAPVDHVEDEEVRQKQQIGFQFVIEMVRHIGGRH